MKRIALTILFFTYFIGDAQRLDNFGKAKPLSISGGISANSVFYDGTANRDDFTYFLNGSINANVYGLYNIPVSFSYTNQEFNFNEPSFKINRLSLHPSYKWVTAHIGDVAMSFSPYTLNGHQFTGFGFDLTPNNPFKISAMYGRLVREREYDPNQPEALPSYRRMGYGLKTAYEKADYKVGFTVFSAKDELNSLNQIVPGDLNITPKENLVLSVEGEIKFLKKGRLNVEYASSALTNDVRSVTTKSTKLLSNLFNNRASTTYHNAFNADLSYVVGTGSIGVGYERVDPQYQTLGAYYFNNDLENITVKVGQTLFSNKLNVNLNAGLQRDDLNNQKQSELSRLVGAVNLNYRANDKLTLSGAYSNFRAHTQIKNQFDYINEVRPFDNLDTLNFTQVSQNANLNVNYNLIQKKKKRHTLNLNFSYQNTNEKQDAFLVDIQRNNSDFFNGNLAYNIIFTDYNLSVTGAFNSTYNTIGGIETTTLGPTLALSKQFFEKQLRTTFSSSYNTTATDGEKQGDIMNFRLGANYRYKQNHNFNLNAIQLLRNSETLSSANDFTATLGYAYTFTNRKKRSRRIEKINPENAAKASQPELLLKINYKQYQVDGTPSRILKYIDSLHTTINLDYLDDLTSKNLVDKYTIVKNSDRQDGKKFKSDAEDYLKVYNAIDETLEVYQEKVTKAVQDLAADITLAHDDFEKKYVETRGELNKIADDHPEYQTKKKAFEDAKKVFMHHSWILKQLQRPEKQVLNDLHIFKGSMLKEVTLMKNNGKNSEQIAAQIKLALIAFYDEQASKYASEKDINILNYD